ncbi:cysteine desulfurase family protein [Mesorhizobium sp. BAC0120]|uniref:cysteine desulfurase family protein n=1 Tax=Mesorhizobium sp. BAC0120 TaxID=3090670 RepID=UPI00298D0189|nr:cysteine desulfurase family protein [Mesorhizobium sp. BAC0120]MDW6023878.1 cysteine desulfurase family protein [Mesorhizobium sp. BAC0120]
MAERRAYLDHNASAPLLASARAAMLAALDVDANPSSVHAEGRAARKVVEAARRSVAGLVGAQPGHIVFTSGATEAATTLLTPDWQMGRGAVRMSRLYVAASDHPCLLSGGRFGKDQVHVLPVGSDGLLDLDALRAALASHERSEGLPLVAVHTANNETGVIQPVAKIARLVGEAGGVLVLDSVQAVGRVPVDISCGDYLIVSSHKVGGPKGAGAIVAKSDLMMPMPLVRGGGQEKGHRAGTENLAAIAGFGAAAAEAAQRLGDMNAVRARRDRIEDMILRLMPGAMIFGKDAERLPNTTFFALPGIKAETAQIAFDLAGVAVSAGSACSSGKVGPSHVLKAMGFGDDAGALRVSIGHSTSDEELQLFADALAAIVGRHEQRTKAA